MMTYLITHFCIGLLLLAFLLWAAGLAAKKPDYRTMAIVVVLWPIIFVAFIAIYVTATGPEE